MQVQKITNRYNFWNNSRKECRALPFYKKNDDSKISFKSTGAGKPLKKLEGIPCAYTGVQTMNSKTLSRAFKRIEKAADIKDIVQILNDYKEFLQKTELKIFEYLEKYAQKYPNKQIPDCFKELYDEAHAKLKIEEFMVLDEVDKISNGLSAKTALQVRTQVTHCRELIINNKEGKFFKRKDLLDFLDTMTPSDSEKETFENMKDMALYLPSSATSENAFVVKYVKRSQEEIAKRILNASRRTIEHVDPAFSGGKDVIGNFSIAASVINSLRGHLSLVKFIKRFPDIPKFYQKYIDAIIDAIHRGEMHGNEAYPYKLRRTLLRASQKLISLDLSKYKISYKDAYKEEKLVLSKRKKKR